ncbi:phosphopantothenate--cysteine ligase [Plakobranchus ocellatus]|uniref:Phosphopantothenate--cysteine ligase n=1 Tax=Plakobranchus ocellatus TaxID=259542 RepID=A0AAV4CFE0_9GAST|nr:phosphopantothenate--cysteine ligase [Plakobranchus ocellatus]
MTSPRSTAFFEGLTISDNFESRKLEVDEFTTRHAGLGNRIVLITSGGTTVPLESRTVRFIDNFSIGTRGATSAEYFLKQGYAVLFLHRHRSLQPFHHRVNKNILDVLSVEESNGTTIKVQAPFVASLVPVVQQYHHYHDSGMLCQVDFTTLEEYLLLLRAACHALQVFEKSAIIYLAAAVSDFYIPAGQLPEHKIQSSGGKLQLSLEMTPKMLKPLVKEWAPQAFTVSFKLETDPELLVSKAKGALETYQHQMVIANLLHTRKREVVMITMDMEEKVSLTDEDLDSGKEIEEPLIAKLVAIHREMLS